MSQKKGKIRSEFGEVVGNNHKDWIKEKLFGMSLSTLPWAIGVEIDLI